MWIGLIIAAALLVALVIFIARERPGGEHRLRRFRRPRALAVAPFFVAAVAGMLLVAVPGTERIIQLRRAVEKSPGKIAGPSAFGGSPARTSGPPSP